jgi:hypothetical protein
MTGLGGLMVLAGLANIAGRLPHRWFPAQLPRWVQVIWGAVGVCAGAGFILSTLLSGPGVALGSSGSLSPQLGGIHQPLVPCF